jgi:hypothetical protein
VAWPPTSLGRLFSPPSRLLTPYFTPPPRLFTDFTPPPRSSVMGVMSVITLLFVVVAKNFLDNPPSSLGLNLTRKGDWEWHGCGGGDNFFAILTNKRAITDITTITYHLFIHVDNAISAGSDEYPLLFNGLRQFSERDIIIFVL